MLAGKAVRSAAAAALTGSDADVQNFLAVKLASATSEDNRVALAAAIARGGKGHPPGGECRAERR
ncbi:hypothetical protein ABZW32_30320 [Streptomyces sp. NPDC004667]|uniref:hypothetical protein n=1 Tax=Streptomyces sp. NPDC004667 TaxID=3154285 RepID=UPI0033A227A4